jgi:hypothetical protein
MFKGFFTTPHVFYNGMFVGFGRMMNVQGVFYNAAICTKVLQCKQTIVNGVDNAVGFCCCREKKNKILFQYVVVLRPTRRVHRAQ